MKKVVLIVSVIITLFGVIVTTFPLLMKATGLDKSFKAYILPKLMDAENGKLDYHDFNIGLGKIYFSNVNVASDDSTFRLKIKSLDMKINLFKFMLHPDEPHRTISEISLMEPVLILRKTSTPDTILSNKPYEQTDKLNITAFLQVLNKIQTISEIKLRSGKIFFEDSENELHYIGHNLNGSMQTDDLPNILITADGNMFNSVKKNISSLSRINLNNKNIYTEISMNHHYQYDSSYSFFPEILKSMEAEISGNLIIRNYGLSFDSLFAEGLIQCRNATSIIDSIMVDNVDFDIHLSGYRAELKDGHGLISNHPFKFSGGIENFVNPKITANFLTEKFPLKSLRQYTGFPDQSCDKVNIEADFIMENAFPVLNMNVFSDSLAIFSSAIVSGFNSHIVWKPGIVEMNDFKASINNTDFNGNGKYFTNKKFLSFNLTGTNQFGKHVIFDKISEHIQSFNIRYKHDFNSHILSAKWFYTINDREKSVVDINGSIKGGQENFYVSVDSSNLNGFNAEFSIRNVFTEPFIERSKISNLPFACLISDQNLRLPFEKYSTSMELSGDLADLIGKIYLTEKTDPESRYQLNAHIKNLFSSEKKILGSLQLKNFLAYYDFQVFADSLGGIIASPDGIDGKISLDLKDEEKLKGILHFRNFNVIENFLDDGGNIDNMQLQGIINGEISFAGSLRSPEIIADLSGDKFVFNSIGYYQAHVLAKFDTKVLELDTVEISLNNHPIIAGNLKWILENDFLSGKLEGDQIRIADVLSAFKPDDVFLTGTANYQINVKGSKEHPWIETDLQIIDGSLWNTDFDHLDASLVYDIGDISNIFKISEHQISVNNLLLGKTGEFHISGEGTLPLSTKNPLDIKVNFDGDLFRFLPRIEKFFENGASLASAHLHIGGDYNEIRFLSCDIDIERGELWLRDVAPYIENIHGKIMLEEGTNEVNFKNFTANMDKQYLKINTVRNIKLKNGKSLKHWYFKGLDLDFGILTMETSAEGVSLHIPGLMEDDETGSLYLSGRDGEDYFYFAGPADHPLAYGNLTLYDTRLTYPFLVSDKPRTKPSPAVVFLQKVNWNVFLTSGEDVVYQRKIPAYIDNVNTELYVDETSKGLYFTGIIDESSFGVAGQLFSTRGRLEYLDQNFKVDRFTVEFLKTDDLPVISGKAWTSIRDSIGATPKTIYLQLYAVDAETGMEKQQGGWDEFKFKLISADPQIGETQEQVLAYMGFSVDNIKEKATSVGGAVTEKYLIRPLLRPVEKAIEQNLGVDMVRINSKIARNLFYNGLGLSPDKSQSNPAINPFTSTSPYLLLMQSSEVTVGKYLAQNLFLTYTGQLVSLQNAAEVDYGFNHSFGLEYRLLRNVLLEFEYDRELSGIYRFTDQRQYLEDFKIRLRHSFTF
ncbi:MAG: hypothetical protein JXR46_07380 [Calditrichaceae bacterium]|nr:hypothetical protein [Calditrichaceae bacterium]MBN2708850.1 hypothetical protein [Calditrichaceae bacterium]RQV97623.1 MAG: hypothetical protein EH224_00975 [Calditrichota bacterium]